MMATLPKDAFSLVAPVHAKPLDWPPAEAGQADNEQEAYTKVVAMRHSYNNQPCCRELFLGVFFDGTNNNQDRDTPKHRHSNIARLHDIYPNKPAGGYFRIYVPGVGTRFEAIGDSGEGESLLWGDKSRGLAFAAKGEARIVYALLSVLNSLHKHFIGIDFPKLTKEKIGPLANDLTQDYTLSAALPLSLLFFPHLKPDSALFIRRQRINAKRRKALGDLHQELLERSERQRKTGKPKIIAIRLSVFGFSRGAAQARVFANWLSEILIDGKLCGIPLHFDFMGVFDTVASVGLASSTLVGDGHMEWADAEQSLRVVGPMRCLHLVSAHEIRRSFPLDSIQAGGAAIGSEVVYPGVHSDVGGGYAPGEQGRGRSRQGHDLLSRIPLAHMYRAARLCNVPFNLDDPDVPAAAREAMQVDAATINALNDYLRQCTVKAGHLSQILDEQTRLYVRWRRLHLDDMRRLKSVVRANEQDYADLIGANDELRQEVKLLSAPPRDLLLREAPMADRMLLLNPMQALGVAYLTAVVDHLSRTGVDLNHYRDWERLKTDWQAAGTLPEAVDYLLSEYVHDSRAWFKPLGDDDEVWKKKQIEHMRALKMRTERANDSANTWAIDGPPPTDREYAALYAYKTSGALPVQEEAREPFSIGGGYLRYRRVYYGSDAGIVVRLAK